MPRPLCFGMHQVLGLEDEFLRVVDLVISEVKFDEDLVVSVFETNIRVLGGLLGAHSMMLELTKQAPRWPNATWARSKRLHQYHGELLDMALDLGNRLLRAFDTKTGLPYSRINLKRGLDTKSRASDATCTACAGTLLLEFAALSRFTGDPSFERAARGAMEALWKGRRNDLVGETINITSGRWLRTDAGVGAGIDSYYEYLLKAWIMLDDPVYLDIFNQHYDAIMRYMRRGPFMINTPINNPGSMARKFMDSLQMFWPGLQVLKGDIEPAIETHKMYFQLAERYGFSPEAFTMDLKIHWGNWPLRPEFAESTYFLYTATHDPYYLRVGKTILDNLRKFTKVKCGFAAISDVRLKNHEDKMDSFLLAETFKYLYLLFVDPKELSFDLDEYVFTTEAHLLPVAIPGPSSYHLAPFDRVVLQRRQSSVHDHACPNTGRRGDSSYGMSRGWLGGPWGTCAKYSAPKKSNSTRIVKVQLVQSDPEPYNGPHISPEELDLSQPSHVAFLKSIDIYVQKTDEGIRLLFQAAKGGDTSKLGESEGLIYIKKLMELQAAQSKSEEQEGRGQVSLEILDSNGDVVAKMEGGPASFGPNLDGMYRIYDGELVVSLDLDGCSPVPQNEYSGRVVLVRRGGCMFIEKVRYAEAAGANAVVIFNNRALSDSHFTMSGDGTDEITIPSLFISQDDGVSLEEQISTASIPLRANIAGMFFANMDTVIRMKYDARVCMRGTRYNYRCAMPDSNCKSI